MEPKYEIDVQLTGRDGNAFNLMGLVRKAPKEEKVPQNEIDDFLKECQESDYDHLLITCMKWVRIH